MSWNNGYHWLSFLPLEVRAKFIFNLTNGDGQRDEVEFLEHPYHDLHAMINTAFTWSFTPEGHDYWHSIANSLNYKLKPYNDGTE